MQRQFLQMYIEDNNLDIYKYKHNVRDEEKNIFEVKKLLRETYLRRVQKFDVKNNDV